MDEQNLEIILISEENNRTYLLPGTPPIIVRYENAIDYRDSEYHTGPIHFQDESVIIDIGCSNLNRKATRLYTRRNGGEVECNTEDAKGNFKSSVRLSERIKARLSKLPQNIYDIIIQGEAELHL